MDNTCKDVKDVTHTISWGDTKGWAIKILKGTPTPPDKNGARKLVSPLLA